MASLEDVEDATRLEGGGALEQRFAALSRLLVAHHALWAHRPFVQLPAPWEDDYPEVSRWARSLDERAVEAYEAAADAVREPPGPDFAALPGAPPPPSRLRELASSARALCEVLPLPQRSAGVEADDEQRRHLSWKIPGRKLEQILAFGRVALCGLGAAPRAYVDWCAGKGHLGRTLSLLSGLPAVCIETQATLCERGAALTERVHRLQGRALSARCRFVTASVFEPNAHEELGPDVTALALHACGDLGIELLVRAVERGVPALALAPCCYHRVPGGSYRPLSRAGAASGLELAQPGLRLPAAEEVTARAGMRAMRRREMVWRLAFDQLRREASGDDRYRSLPPLPPRWFRLPLAAFCARAATLEGGTALPARWDAEALEREATQRVVTARALGLVRAVFRRPLELWLVLDRALWVAERGYRVRVGAFCARDLTPRNLALLAEKN
ncbi:MAG: methyltransferase [Myxococcales bacterium]|nr:methyltransferase [Myxococcales bacterium]